MINWPHPSATLRSCIRKYVHVAKEVASFRGELGQLMGVASKTHHQKECKMQLLPITIAYNRETV